MRDSNYKSIPLNKAAVSITTNLYDRRALDSTSDRPLVNSLNHLTFLTSSSAKVRETLSIDGGLERLISILHECKQQIQEGDESDNDDDDNKDNQTDSDMNIDDNFQTDLGSADLSISKQKKNAIIAWKWTLAFQCLVLIGTRGTEKIRKRVVEAGIIPIIATVLDNYLLITRNFDNQLDNTLSTTFMSLVQSKIISNLRQKFNNKQQQQQDQDSEDELQKQLNLHLDRNYSLHNYLNDNYFKNDEDCSESYKIRSEHPIVHHQPEQLNDLDLTITSPRLFIKGILIPKEDDVVWSLQLLAFISKYSNLKDFLQYTHLIDSLSLRSLIQPSNSLASGLIPPPLEQDDLDNEMEFEIISNFSSDDNDPNQLFNQMNRQRQHQRFLQYQQQLHQAHNQAQQQSQGIVDGVQDGHNHPNHHHHHHEGDQNDVSNSENQRVQPELSNTQSSTQDFTQPSTQSSSQILIQNNLSNDQIIQENDELSNTTNSTIKNESTTPTATNNNNNDSNETTNNNTNDNNANATTSPMINLYTNLMNNDNNAIDENFDLDSSSNTNSSDNDLQSLNNELLNDKSRFSTTVTEQGQQQSQGQGQFPNQVQGNCVTSSNGKTCFTKSLIQSILNFENSCIQSDEIQKQNSNEKIINSYQETKYLNLVELSIKLNKFYQTKFEDAKLSKIQKNIEKRKQYESKWNYKSYFEKVWSNQSNNNNNNNKIQDFDKSTIITHQLNIFPLVEKFTIKTLNSSDMCYWSGVIMRNSCRKDENRGGVRQCASFQCGKWENFPREFAKCRRCKRTKYCSKECQLKAWVYHKHWCVDSNSSSGTGSSQQNKREEEQGVQSVQNGIQERLPQ